MRYLLALTAVFLFFLVPEYPVYAHNGEDHSTKTLNFEQKLIKESEKDWRKEEKKYASNEAMFKKNVASSEADFKRKLETFTNKSKVDIVTRINSNLQKVNQNVTSRMQKQLEQLTKALLRLEGQLNESTSSANQAQGQAAIDQAKQAIADASAALTAQSQKVYQVEISTEENAKVDASAARNSLHNDLKTLQQSLKKAKMAVVNAFQVVGGK